jgi:prepilin-type N-terminal cleavage/methylation domain-containing protein
VEKWNAEGSSFTQLGWIDETGTGKEIEMKTWNSEKGFTLLEVLVAVSIVAVLAAAVAPTVFQHVKESRVAKAKNDGKVIGEALVRFRSDMDTWPGFADGGTLNRRVNGLLFGEKGDWPKIDSAQAVPGGCDLNDDGDLTDAGEDVATIDECDAANEGIYISWLPVAADTVADGIWDPVTDGCDATSEADLRARIPVGSEFHSPASLESQLIQNAPILARYGSIGPTLTADTDTGLLYDPATVQVGTATDGNTYFSMVMNDCSIARTIELDRARQYKYKESNRPDQAGWNGAYVQDIPADPWGRKYLVNLHFSFAGTDHQFEPEAHEWNPLYVLSAGPNGLIETPVGEHAKTAPGVEPQPGGDDVITVVNLSQRTTM